MATARHRYKSRRGCAIDTCVRCGVGRRFYRATWFYRASKVAPWTTIRPRCGISAPIGPTFAEVEAFARVLDEQWPAQVSYVSCTRGGGYSFDVLPGSEQARLRAIAAVAMAHGARIPIGGTP